MDSQVAAHRLNEIALLLEVRGENPFKSRAFTHAARTIGELEEEDIAPMVRSKELSKLPGIGATTFAVLAELVETGESAYLQSLRESTPAGLVEMLRIPGLGPTRIQRLHEGLGIESVTDLEAAIKDGRIAKMSGFGVKTADKILKGIATLRETSGQLMHTVAYPEAARLQRAIARLDGVRHVGITGASIAAISERPLRGTRVIDATGHVVSPGFVDLHEHGQQEESYALMVRDGVTSALASGHAPGSMETMPAMPAVLIAAAWKG